MPVLTIYRLLTIGLTPFAGVALGWRARQGKEDPQRLGERMGVASLARPAGRLVWLHGASLGESLSLLPLVERFIQRGVEVLVTTGTVSSAKVLRARLPAGAAHQFLPLDAPQFVERFLEHWRPDIALFAESELWPNMIRAIHARRLPLILVNATISRRSAARWRRLPGGARTLFGEIDLCLAQNAESAARYLGLGAPRVRVCGNLKFDVPPPPVGAGKLAEFNGAIGARPVWAAISTHAGEEEIAIDAHLTLAAELPSLLTIIAPRKPERGAEIAALARAKGLDVGLRSQDGEPRRGVQIYVADTMGELGLFLRAVSVVFTGKSLTAEGGHNPIEPAKLGCAILHGPHVENFADIYAELAAARAAARVTDAESLARALQFLLSDPSRMRKMGRAGTEVVKKLGGASQSIMAAIEPYLAQSALEQR
ncbi:3-deoxy-D-manno-octulosonic acid transferase [Methylosinus sp. Ce-a6]|uniref:3-deoxy-D-manno-octulosonic acid transferase n=1 Tax=Methylosinus sp. Ce-a6 TaxID=2172005 RepID=UPI00135C8086|nr:3-deoxy-D-manno-octulosonic acid transferase [Methylosinus sp. Ce-a6]